MKEVQVIRSENNVACVSQYDKFGHLTYRSFDDFKGFPNLKSSMEWIYNDNGKVIKTISTHSSSPIPSVWIYEYDKQGNNIATKRADGKLLFEFFYDDAGFLIKKLAFDDDDSIRRTSIYEKSDNGRKITEKNTGRSKTIGRINTTYLDGNGNIIKHESYDGSKVNALTIYTYENSRHVKTIEYSGGGKNYIYDSKGQLVKIVHFKTIDNIETEDGIEELEYDDKGMIIKYTDEDLKAYIYRYEFYE